MLDTLNQIESEGLAGLAAAGDAESLEAWRLGYLGGKGRLKAAMGGMKDVPKQEKKAVGQRMNELKGSLEAAFEARKAELGVGSTKPVGRFLDVTEPGEVSAAMVGRRHILQRVRRELVDVFGRMGFEVAEGPELEDDEHNFVKLNIPPDHPAQHPRRRHRRRLGCCGARRARCRFV